MKLSEIKRYIYSDLYRYEGRDGVFLLMKYMLKNKFFRFLVWFRLTKSDNLFLRTVARMLKASSASKTGIQIHMSVDIGYGLFIPHGNVVVNASAKIGDNCNLCQYVTIGSVNKSAANVGDCVYISPGVCLVEKVNVGNNVIIGAGAVVNRCIPDSSVVAGVPAKIIGVSSKIEDFIKNRYEHS